MKKYEIYTLKSKVDLDSKYDLRSFTDIVYNDKPRKEMAFSALIIQSSYVWFYFTPIYTDPESLKMLWEKLLRTLKWNDVSI